MRCISLTVLFFMLLYNVGNTQVSREYRTGYLSDTIYDESFTIDNPYYFLKDNPLSEVELKINGKNQNRIQVYQKKGDSWGSVKLEGDAFKLNNVNSNYPNIRVKFTFERDGIQKMEDQPGKLQLKTFLNNDLKHEHDFLFLPQPGKGELFVNSNSVKCKKGILPYYQVRKNSYDDISVNENYSRRTDAKFFLGDCKQFQAKNSSHILFLEDGCLSFFDLNQCDENIEVQPQELNKNQLKAYYVINEANPELDFRSSIMRGVNFFRDMHFNGFQINDTNDLDITKNLNELINDINDNDYNSISDLIESISKSSLKNKLEYRKLAGYLSKMSKNIFGEYHELSTFKNEVVIIVFNSKSLMPNSFRAYALPLVNQPKYIFIGRDGQKDHVVSHEWGHILGLNHLASNSGIHYLNVMNPGVREKRKYLTLAQLVKCYNQITNLTQYEDFIIPTIK